MVGVESFETRWDFFLAKGLLGRTVFEFTRTDLAVFVQIQAMGRGNSFSSRFEAFYEGCEGCLFCREHRRYCDRGVERGDDGVFPVILRFEVFLQRFRNR